MACRTCARRGPAAGTCGPEAGPSRGDTAAAVSGRLPERDGRAVGVGRGSGSLSGWRLGLAIAVTSGPGRAVASMPSECRCRCRRRTSFAGLAKKRRRVPCWRAGPDRERRCRGVAVSLAEQGQGPRLTRPSPAPLVARCPLAKNPSRCRLVSACGAPLAGIQTHCGSLGVASRTR